MNISQAMAAAVERLPVGRTSAIAYPAWKADVEANVQHGNAALRALLVNRGGELRREVQQSEGGETTVLVWREA